MDETAAALFKVDITLKWYIDVLHLSCTGSYPSGPFPLKKRQLLLKTKPFTRIGGQLYKAGPDGILRGCFSIHEVQPIFENAHGGPFGGHYLGHIVAQHII